MRAATGGTSPGPTPTSGRNVPRGPARLAMPPMAAACAPLRALAASRWIPMLPGLRDSEAVNEALRMVIRLARTVEAPARLLLGTEPLPVRVRIHRPARVREHQQNVLAATSGLGKDP